MDIGTANTAAFSLGEVLWEQVQVYCQLYLWLAVHYPVLLRMRVI